MFSIARPLINTRPVINKVLSRTFLSPAYYCNEVWNHRLNSPILNKINLELLYQDLDNRYQKSGLISAVDVDVFVNSAKDETYTDELLDLVHKLRMSADTTNTLNSTSHAVVRYLLKSGKHNELLNVLDDRLNYGLFIDYYTANILMDKFYKSKNFAAGVRIASQLMLQEETAHPISAALAKLLCCHYLLEPKDWEEPPPQEEPEEEVKVRVRFVRNPYNDGHFDLKKPLEITGKTLIEFTKNNLSDSTDRSLHVLGLSLLGKHDKAIGLIKKTDVKLEKSVIELIPAENPVKEEASKLQLETSDVLKLLQARVADAEKEFAEKDVAEQCNVYSKWEEERKDAIERQRVRLSTATRLQNVEATRRQMKDKENKLWFFEKEEDIELQIDEQRINAPKEDTKQMENKVEAEYVPPQV